MLITTQPKFSHNLNNATPQAQWSVRATNAPATDSVVFRGNEKNVSVKVTQELVNHPRQMAPQWNTLVYHIPSAAGPVRLRLYNSQDSHQKKLPILFLPGRGTIPQGGAPFTEHGVQAPGPIYSMDRPYIEEDGSMCFDADKIMMKAKAVLDYLYTLTGQKIPVVGFSLGSVIAARLASEEPHKISNLALMSPAFHTRETMAKVLNNYKDRKHPDNIIEYQKLAGDPRTFISQIRVPTALYVGEKENYLFDLDFLRSLWKAIPLPESQKRFKIFEGPGEDHSITDSRLQALRLWLEAPEVSR